MIECACIRQFDIYILPLIAGVLEVLTLVSNGFTIYASGNPKLERERAFTPDCKVTSIPYMYQLRFRIADFTTMNKGLRGTEIDTAQFRDQFQGEETNTKIE